MATRNIDGYIITYKHQTIEHQNKLIAYKSGKLDKHSVSDDPFDQFANWFLQADEIEGLGANATTLSTVDEAGRPSSRIVLLKEVTEAGFVYYTHYQSRKSIEVQENPFVSLLFYWPKLERQVRIQGKVEKYYTESSTKYFQSRLRSSQIYSWASPQSQIIQDHHWLERQVDRREIEFAGKKSLPRPPFWGGYICLPDYFEFWQGRESQLHDRISYKYEDGDWTLHRLAP